MTHLRVALVFVHYVDDLPGHCLQVYHPRHGWTLPAGKINVGELPYVAACRELEEETGYRCDRLRAIKRFEHMRPDGTSYDTHAFVASFWDLQGTLRAEVRPDGEARPVRWAPASELSPLSIDTIARMLGGVWL